MQIVIYERKLFGQKLKYDTHLCQLAPVPLSSDDNLRVIMAKHFDGLHEAHLGKPSVENYHVLFELQCASRFTARGAPGIIVAPLYLLRMVEAVACNDRLPPRGRHVDERASSDIAHITATAGEGVRDVDLSHGRNRRTRCLTYKVK